MPSKNPRVNVVLEEPLYRTVETLARREGVSLSQKVRDLVREAVELVEDQELEAIVEARRAAGGGRWLTHAEVQRRLKSS